MPNGSRASIVEHRASPAQQLVPGAFRHSSLRGINRKDERLDPQAWLTDVLSRIAPSRRRRSPTSASRVSSSSSKSTGNRRRPESAEINDERRPAAAHPGRLLRILMKFVNKP
jgi:hypothetical protein